MGAHVIPVVSASGEGVTPIAAFDAALLAAGVGNVNLVALSSIIPPGHDVVVVDDGLAEVDRPGFGDLAFVVMAEQRALSGAAVAGLAWVNTPDLSGGLFLEGHGTDFDEVADELDAGMKQMIAARPEMNLDVGSVESVVCATDSEGTCCAVVVAVFESRQFNARLDR